MKKQQKTITSQPRPATHDIVSQRWRESSPNPVDRPATQTPQRTTWAEYLNPGDPWQQGPVPGKPLSSHPGPVAGPWHQGPVQGKPLANHPGPVPGPWPQGQMSGKPPASRPAPVETKGNWKEPSNSSNGWMNMIETPLDRNMPAALQQLASLDQLRVHQRVECCEVCTCCETQNKYQVKTPYDQEVFFAKEKSDCCARNCCGAIRPFEMKIMDNDFNEVIHLHRPLKCQSCWCPCCLQTMEVTTPGGTRLGQIEQEWSLICPRYRIKNAAGDVVFKIKGPFWLASCGCEIPFKILAIDGRTQLGQISKQWSGCCKEFCTKADNFKIKFPADLDVQMKSVILGASFLIDYMFYELPACF